MITIGKRTLDAENHWQLTDKIEGKCVIVFGGNTTDNERSANGNAKLWQNVAKLNSSKVNIYAVNYDKEIIGDNHSILRNEFLDELDQMYLQYFRPLLFKKTNLKSEDGLSKTFGEITFIAHCAGANVLNHIIGRWKQDIMTLNMDGKISNIDNLVRKIQVVAYAPHIALNHNVKTLYVAPYFDRESTWQKPLDAIKDAKLDRESPACFMEKYQKRTFPGEQIQKSLKENPMIVVQSGSTVVVVPNAMSKNGDHSPEVLFHSEAEDSPRTIMATAVRTAVGKTINMFVSGNKIDMRKVYNHFEDASEYVLGKEAEPSKR